MVLYLRLNLILRSILMVMLVYHLLISHDIFHDEIFVLFPYSLVQFLLILTDQLLYVYIILLLLLLNLLLAGFSNLLHLGL